VKVLFVDDIPVCLPAVRVVLVDDLPEGLPPVRVVPVDDVPICQPPVRVIFVDDIPVCLPAVRVVHVDDATVWLSLVRAVLAVPVPIALSPVRVVLVDAVPISLPPVRVVFVDDVEYVAPLEGDAQLVAGDVEVVIRHVGEVCAVVIHGLALLLFHLILGRIRTSRTVISVPKSLVAFLRPKKSYNHSKYLQTVLNHRWAKLLCLLTVNLLRYFVKIIY